MKSFKYLVVLAVAAPLALGVGCKKKEEAKVAPPAPAAEQPISIKKEDIKVIIPDGLKGKWKDVKVEVLDKQANKKTVVTIPVGGEAGIPGSNMKIKAEAFLPAFVMEGTNITSASNDPKNPAAQIVVTEEGKEIHKGWLFTLYPTTHPFEHPKYSLTLVGFDPVK